MNPRALRTAIKFLASVIGITAGALTAIVAAVRGHLWIFPTLVVGALAAVTISVYRDECRNERSDRDRAS